MLPPYVQDVNKWVNYYKNLKGNKGNASSPKERGVINVSNSSGLAQQGTMSVLKVEPKGPAPPVPSTGPSAALNNVTSSEGSLQQSIYDAKREQIQQTKSAGGSHSMKRKPSKKKSAAAAPAKKGNSKIAKSKKASTTRNGKKKLLFGTPADIFKAKGT